MKQCTHAWCFGLTNNLKRVTSDRLFCCITFDNVWLDFTFFTCSLSLSLIKASFFRRLSSRSCNSFSSRSICFWRITIFSISLSIHSFFFSRWSDIFSLQKQNVLLVSYLKTIEQEDKNDLKIVQLEIYCSWWANCEHHLDFSRKILVLGTKMFRSHNWSSSQWVISKKSRFLKNN